MRGSDALYQNIHPVEFTSCENAVDTDLCFIQIYTDIVRDFDYIHSLFKKKKSIFRSIKMLKYKDFKTPNIKILEDDIQVFKGFFEYSWLLFFSWFPLESIFKE